MVVFRYNRGMALRPVQRIKHVIDTQIGINGGTNHTANLILASDTPALASVEQVQTGSTVHGIYLKVEVYAVTAGSLSNCYLSISKNPGGNLTIPNPNSVGSSDNKKYVIHQEMIMLERQVNGNPRTLFNGVIKIPKGYKRFGPNDGLEIKIRPPGVNIDACYQCHYKEFR